MLGLAAGSALGWTFFDFSRRRVGESLPAIPSVIAIMVLQTLLCLPFGGWGALESQSSAWFTSAGLSILTNTLANILFIMAMQRAAFTLVVPLLSLTPAFAAAAGWIMFGEALGLQAMIGIAIVVAAALWLGWQGEGRKTTRQERVAMAMMCSTAVMWAITPFFDRACTKDGTVTLAAYVGSQCLGVALMCFVVAVFNSRLRASLRGVGPHLKTAAPWVFLAALAASVGLYFQIKGVLTVSHVGLFEAVKRSLTMLMSLAIGRFILKEHLTRAKIFAAVIMAGGIFLLA
jgi:drug/metabolite transporter (DMT)-like permease